MNAAGAFRAQDVHDRGDTGIFRQLKILADQEGNPRDRGVRRIQPAAGANISTDRRRRQAKQPLVGEGVFQRLPTQAEAARLIVVGHTEREWDGPFHARRVMVAQVLANAVELVANLDADTFEQGRLADTRQLQKLRRIDRTGADNDLPVGAGFVLLAVYVVAHADATFA